MDQSADTRTYTFNGAVIYESFQTSNTTIDYLADQVNKALVDGIELTDVVSCRSKVKLDIQLKKIFF